VNRNILITGVSSGIGLALARVYLRAGFEVFGVSRREATGLLAEPAMHFQSIDLACLSSIPPKIQALLDGVTHLQLIVLNAAMLGRIADLREMPIEELHRVMDVNLWANHQILNTLFNSGKTVRQVVAISSGAAVTAFRGWNVYSISKAALNKWIELLAVELPDTHFSAIAPGIVHTPVQDYLASLPPDDRFPSLDYLRRSRGTARMPEPEHAAKRLAIGISRALQHRSGSFLEIDQLLQNA
jgi:benzil reductase ((S)-benzoin forming)